jgi:hypothetical protein
MRPPSGIRGRGAMNGSRQGALGDESPVGWAGRQAGSTSAGRRTDARGWHDLARLEAWLEDGTALRFRRQRTAFPVEEHYVTLYGAPPAGWRSTESPVEEHYVTLYGAPRAALKSTM